MNSQTLRQLALNEKASLELVQGDITQEAVDAIVNAANSSLRHGGGVAAAISRKGGPTVQKESNAWIRQHGSVSHDKPAYTSAGSLPCKYIIHAVGPVWGSGDEDAKLAASVRGSLLCADQLALQSIAFPAISTGIFGFPKNRAAEIMIRTITDYIAQEVDTNLKLVRITLFDSPTVEAFLSVWDQQKKF